MSDNVLNLPDEEVMNMTNPPEVEAKTEEQEHDEDISTNDEQIVENIDNSDNITELDGNEENNDDYQDNSSIPDNNSEMEEQDVDNPNYEDFYKKVMAPFKANGKQYNLKNADEVVSLMQKGVDYTKKTQDLSKYKKAIAMLERAELLDDNQISFFIDLKSGNKEAIRKLLKDKDLDILDLPSYDDEPINYVEGTHNISSEELNFKEATDEIIEQNKGQEFLEDFKNKYDSNSQALLYRNPQLMKAIFVQKQNGIYDKIVTEMERQKVLGMLPSDAPFLQAYKYIGESVLGLGNGANSRNGSYPQPLARRSANTYNRLNNSQRAKSAGITRTSQSTVNSNVNYLKMSDDDFLKQFSI